MLRGKPSVAELCVCGGGRCLRGLREGSFWKEDVTQKV